ncbi:unnamed protein product [Linum trigynum]|uniref:Uncharacterized protein n=1 Tax=Linum trigynum TaxID=586398 RepID=A0AAV2D5J0_9ROSI
MNVLEGRGNVGTLIAPDGVAHPMPGRRPGDSAMGQQPSQHPCRKAQKRKPDCHPGQDFEPGALKKRKVLKSVAWRFRLPSSVELEKDEGVAPTSPLFITSGLVKARPVINVVLPCPLL